METITITANSNATRRTRNRVRENGAEFQVIMGIAHNVTTKQGSLLVRSMRSEWFGWLPINEIEININSCD